MLIVDDLLAAPMKGLIWVFKEIQQQATDVQQRHHRKQIETAPHGHHMAKVQVQMTKDSRRKPTLLEKRDPLHAQGQERHEGALNGRKTSDTETAGTKPESALKTIPAVKVVDGPTTATPEPMGPEQPQTENPS